MVPVGEARSPTKSKLVWCRFLNSRRLVSIETAMSAVTRWHSKPTYRDGRLNCNAHLPRASSAENLKERKTFKSPTLPKRVLGTFWVRSRSTHTTISTYPPLSPPRHGIFQIFSSIRRVFFFWFLSRPPFFFPDMKIQMMTSRGFLPFRFFSFFFLRSW